MKINDDPKDTETDIMNPVIELEILKTSEDKHSPWPSIPPPLSSLAKIFTLEYSRGRDLYIHQVQENVFKNGEMEETLENTHKQ